MALPCFPSQVFRFRVRKTFSRVIVISMRPGRRLHSTFQDSSIHDLWCHVYRRSPEQNQLDDEVYDWLFAKLLPRGIWLDAGCGTGLRAAQLAKRGADVVAVDVSPKVLEFARSDVKATDYGSRITFQVAALEEPLDHIRVDHVHCRGVLMHIPEWEAALAHICGCVQPSKFIVLFESSHRSLEAMIVRMIRLFAARTSQLRSGTSGMEFWSEVDGNPFLVRIANLKKLEQTLRDNNVTPLFRRCTELFDPNRFPERMRGAVCRLNRLWFRYNLPLGVGFILVGRKESH